VLKGNHDITLHREDQVIIQDITGMRQKRTIQLVGEVQKPGQFDFSDNMTLKDLIFKAGGFTEAASESFIELARRHNYAESNQISDEIVKLFQFNIDRKLNLDPKSDSFLIHPFDYIYVRRAPSYHEQRSVTISGEVRYPGAYSIGTKQERISDLVTRAGGLMPNAFVKGARMQRTNQQAAQNINAMRNSMGDSLLVKAEKQIASDQLELRLDNILKNPGSPFDYLLKDGDQIVIPEVSQEVRISGEIQNPIGQAYEAGRNLRYYVNRSGGFNDKALKRKVFVIYSDGTTQITHNFLGHHYPDIEPGSQIIVPQKPEKQRTDQTGKWLGIASTMGTIAIAIATLLSLGGGATP
jgi:protein involved in polysaccharide export with SLBB domain